MKVVSAKICPFVQRVTALLEAKRITYEIEYISLNNKPQWFLDISPNAQVPVLVTDTGIALFESGAICEYLDEISKPIEGHISSEQRALDRAWSYMAAKNYLTQCSVMRSATSETLNERLANLSQLFTKAEAVLAEGPFFKGAALSNVDIAWLPLLHRSDIICKYTTYDLLAGNPKVQAWRKALMNSDIVEKSVSEDFEKVFTNFYLSNETYLGTKKCCVNPVKGREQKTDHYETSSC